MNTSQEVLFKLIRLSLGNETDFSMPDDVDWGKVVEYASSQGVAAMALDGVQKMRQHKRCQGELSAIGLNPLDSPDMACIKFDWYGQTLFIEGDYIRHKNTISDLMAFYKEIGVKPLVFKGYGLSLEYPIPEHRTSGDIDVYLFGLGEYGDQKVGALLGIDIKQNEDKHSIFEYQGISVENHASFTNIEEYPSHRILENFLLSEAEKAESVDMNGSMMFLPTTMFNAVFLPCHIANHFVFGGMSLKQLVDWAVFVERHWEAIDWPRVLDLADGAGFLPFLKMLNGITIRFLGADRKCFPDDLGSEMLQNKMVDELFLHQVDKLKESNLSKIRRYFRAKWKFDLVFDENYYLSFFKHGWASFRGRYLKNSRSVWS